MTQDLIIKLLAEEGWCDCYTICRKLKINKKTLWSYLSRLWKNNYIVKRKWLGRVWYNINLDTVKVYEVVK